MTLLPAERTDNAVTEQAGLFSAEFKQRFLSYLNVSPASVRTYSRAIESFLQYVSDERIAAPSREDILRYLEHLIAEGKRPSTVQTYLVAVRLFFRFLEQNRLAVNVAEHIKGPRLDKGHKKDCLTQGQTKDLMESVDTDTAYGRRDYAMLLLMAACGLRTIEVVRANIRDMRKAGGRMVLFIQGKGRNERTEFVRLPDAVERAIRASLADRKGASPDDPLFVSYSRNNYGGRLTTRSVSSVAKNALRDIGIDSDVVTAHSLRHTAVTLALLNGIPLQEVQAFARHANIATTLIYAHNLNMYRNRSEDAICSAIFSN